MIALDVLLDIVLFGLFAGGMWWSGTRSVPPTDGRESAAEESHEDDPDIAADGGVPGEGEGGLGTVLNRLQIECESECVLVSDVETEHLTFYAESRDAIGADALSYLSEQGFEILDAGRQECAATAQEQAYLEIRRDAGGRTWRWWR
jgi:hypothetical protein